MSDDLGTGGVAQEPVAVTDAPKQGFFATQTGRIVAIVVGLGVLGIIAGIAVAIALFVFAGQAADEIEVQIQEQTATPPQTGETEIAPTAASPAAPVPNSEVFTFRDIFEPLLKPIPEPSSDTTTTTTPGTTPGATPDNQTPMAPGVLYLVDMITEDGVLKGVFVLDGERYTLAPGDSIPDTPWQLLRISPTEVTMLYGDQQITLTIGQGYFK